MKFLAVDTSTDALSLAIAESHDHQIKVIDHLTQVFDQQHGVTLLPQIQAMMNQHRWQPADIDEVIIGIGPGSYTGLRIGVTLAKMWGHSLDKQISSVSSLALIANQVDATNTYVIPIMDARRLSAYVAIYHKTQDRLVAVLEDQHVDWQVWMQSLTEYIEKDPGAQWVLIGRKIDAFIEIFRQAFPTVQFSSVNAENVFPQAIESFNMNVHHPVADIHTLAPNYAHATLAEREWADKHATTVANEEENERFIEHFS